MSDIVLALPTPAAGTCERCGTELAPALLSCPGCQRLVHGARLGHLATEAEEAERAGYLAAALTCWNEALELLPPESRQHAVVTERVLGLTRRIDAGEGKARPKSEKTESRSAGVKKGGIWVTVGAVLLKLKTVLLLLLGQGKLLLLGLTKGATLLTMLGSVAVYWRLWGWKYAVGFVLCIYVHEMGHVYEMRRYGMKPSAPMFIPGIGALIALRDNLATPRQEARLGLAGPVWGLGAAIACCGLFAITGARIWAALAVSAGGLNLFNLTPVWQLDGAHGFRALTRAQRLMVAGALGVTALLAGFLPLGVVALIAAWRSFTPAAEEPDWRVFGTFAVLVFALSAIVYLALPLAGR